MTDAVNSHRRKTISNGNKRKTNVTLKKSIEAKRVSHNMDELQTQMNWRKKCKLTMAFTFLVQVFFFLLFLFCNGIAEMCVHVSLKFALTIRKASVNLLKNNELHLIILSSAIFCFGCIVSAIHGLHRNKKWIIYVINAIESYWKTTTEIDALPSSCDVWRMDLRIFTTLMSIKRYFASSRLNSM